MNKELNYLTYGSVISISHVQDDNSFITSDGFVKRAVYLQNFHHIDLVSKEDLPLMKSRPYYNTLFQIFPKFTNNTKQEILKEFNTEDQEEEAQPAIQNIIDGIMNQERPEEGQLMTKEQIQQFSNKLLVEFKYNLDTFEKSKDHKVSYKSHIQLLHLASSKFLACHQKEARVESSNYKITLDDLPSDASLFKILPAYKYQKEGEQIIYASEIVYIVRATSFMNKLTYLHASGEMGNYGKSNKRKEKKAQIPMQPNDITKREINAALDEENQTQWRISVYSEYVPETSQYLKCGDVIWLHHSETNTTIAAARRGNPVDMKNFQDFDLIQWLSADNVDLKIIEGSTKESYEEYTGDTHSMWLIEAEKYNEGGVVQFEKLYRFRHLSSGLYLAGSEKAFYLEKQRTIATLFYFAQLKNSQSRDKSIKKGSYVYICREDPNQNHIIDPDVENRFWVDIQIMPKTGQYGVTIHQEQHKTDQSVFKLYVSPSNDVWEISFVLSCIKTLMNYLSDISNLKWSNDASDKEILKDYLMKIQTTKQCIEDINDFCNNKLYNSTPEQKFGTINPFRQKLLKEQYYIDLLVKILDRSLQKKELQMWSRRLMIIQLNDQSDGSVKSGDQGTKGKQVLKDSELLGFVAFKIKLNIQIYQLLQSICKNNHENELYTFDLLSHFIEHCRYIPEAITCLISIVGSNLSLLQRLSGNMLIDFNYKEAEFFEPEEEKMQQQQNQVPKSNNLLYFFLSMLEQDEQPHKAAFLTFLRSMCIFSDAGINQNQETIYKLLKKHNQKKISIVKDREDMDKISVKDGHLMVPLKLLNDPKEMQFINEQLQFYADVSFGRNYLWRRELSQYFSEEFLFANIWAQQQTYIHFQPALCKIAMSLYIDHDPLNRIPLPSFCNLYKCIDLQEHRIQISEQYKRLVQDLFRYLQSNKEKLQEGMIEKNKESMDNQDFEQEAHDQNLLQNELLYNSNQMLRLLLELDVFNLLDQDANDFHRQIIDIVVHFFFYDYTNIGMIRSLYKIQQDEVKARKSRREQKNNLVGINFNVSINMNKFNPINFLGGDDDEENQHTKEDEEDQNEVAAIDDVQMYTNPLMRGFIKLENSLIRIVHEEKSSNQLEIQIKLVLCDMIDRFLDMRQNYLMQNILAFFKTHMIETPMPPLDLNKEGEQNSGLTEDQLKYQQLKKHVQAKTKTHLLGIFPNIAKTGIQDIDEKEKKEDAFKMMMNLGDLMKKKMGDGEPEKEAFEIYAKQIMQIFDPDQYLSLSLGDQDASNPSSCLLPFFLTSFSLIHEESLEKRCLGIIMRLFNQREELQANLQRLQLVSDPVKSRLFEYLTESVQRLNRLVDKSEVWMTDFIKYGNGADIEETIDTIDNMRQGFFKDTQITNRITSKLLDIDPEKQNLMNALKVHTPILNLIRDQMLNFSFNILKMQNLHQKQRLSILFIHAFSFLKFFCKDNHDNQLLLHSHLETFQQLQIEVGQIPLICEIFKNNQKLLTSVGLPFLNKFVLLIEQYGRKEQFLEPFLAIIVQQGKYIFDNQLLVLNTFLQRNMLLYAHNFEFQFDNELQIVTNDFLSDLAHASNKDHPYTYHAKLLELLLQCTLIRVQSDPLAKDSEIRDNFTINVAKLKKTFKFRYLINLLCEPDAFTEPHPTSQMKGLSILKKPLLNFFRHVHITSEKSYSINKEVAQDIVQIFEFETKRLEQLPQMPVARYIEYLADCILPFFAGYLERKNHQNQNDDEEEQQDQEQKDISQLTAFAKILSQKTPELLPYIIKGKQAQSFQNFINFFPNTMLAKALMEQTEENLREFSDVRQQLLNLISGAEEGVNPERVELMIENNKDSPIQSQNGESQQELPKTIFNTSKKKHIVTQIAQVALLSRKKNEHDDERQPLLEFSEQEIEKINLSWEEFVNEASVTEKSKEAVEDERKRLAHAILAFEKYFSENQKVELKVLLKKLINFLQYALNSSACNKTIVTLLLVLRKVIEQEEEFEGDEEEVKEKEAEQKQKVIDMQNLMNKLGATRMVLTVISESTQLDYELLRNLLMFMNSMLSGGNIKVQKTIFEFMKTYPKSEVIFSRLSQIIHAQIAHITKKSKEKQKEEEVLNLQELKQQQELELVMNSVLKFLQNCCEGHYLDLQNYIRQQTNSRNSYNMINIVADLLKAYYYEDRAQYDNMVLCLDTLNELVQGPCPENQMAVSESKFFEIASDLFSKQKENTQGKAQTMVTQVPSSNTKIGNAKSARFMKAQKSTDLEVWQVERMQTKCLILILSLIEMREISDQNPIIKRIMRNLPMNMLQKHMVKCYAKYEQQCKKEYTIEVLDRLKVDPEKKEFPEVYYELILQKGFYIYFLMCYYMESEKALDNQFVQMYRTNTRKKLRKVLGTLEDLLFGDNIIGQLVSFVLSLANSWFELMNYFKKNTLDKLAQKEQTPEQIEKQEREKIIRKKKLVQAAFDFFYKNSAAIEVIRNQEIEIVYFILLPYCQNLPKEQKNEFHELVDRSSTKSKVQYLVQESDRLIEICEHEEQLKQIFQKQKFLALFANYVKLWKDLAFLFTLLLNLFIIGSFSGDYGDRMLKYRLFQLEQYDEEQTRNIFLICGIIMTCCSIFVVSFFLFKNAPLIIKKAWKTKLPLEDKLTYWVFQWIFKLFKLLAVLFYILKEIEVVYYLAYGALAVIGTVVHPFFFAFHLTEILIRYPTLKNVIRSVWNPRQQLALTLVLFIILVYVYALIAYTFFSSDYQGRCESTLFCFLFTFDWTFKANGGIGGYLSDLEDENKEEKYAVGRFIFDNTANIFLVIIMVNIVAGIIIDTFGSLREEESEKIRDIEDKCYICGNLKTTFDRLSDSSAGGGFDQHIKINHYMWNYVFFMAYLKYKDPTDYTGIEQYVFHKMQKKDLTWFPFNRARELQGMKQDEEEESQKLERLNQELQMASVMDQMKMASQTLNMIKSKRSNKGMHVRNVSSQQFSN